MSRLTATPISKSQASKSRARRAGGKRQKRQTDSPVIHPLLQMQQTYGNRAVGRLIQAQLKVSQPGDKYEQEADRVADQVVNSPGAMNSQAAAISSTTQGSSMQRMPETEDSKNELKKPDELAVPTISRMPEEEKDKELHKKSVEGKAEEDEMTPTLQTKPVAHSSPSVNPSVANNINRMQGGGTQLPKTVRAYFEPRIGADFSQVRVHADAHAADTAKSINARAFTVGRNIAFGAGEYSPNTTSGRKLLAHELTHVMQQSISDGIHIDKGNEKRGLSPVVQRQPIPPALQSSVNVRGMDPKELKARYDLIVQTMGQLNASSTDRWLLQMELDNISYELARIKALKAGRTFGDTEVAKMKEYFIKNATSTNPKSCIACMNEAMRLLLGDPQKKMGSEVEKTMAKLQQSGHAGNVRVIEFEDNKGNISKSGTLSPDKLHESVWDAVLQIVGTDVGWSIFGMSLLDGNHSVTLTLDTNYPPVPHIYWSDQWSTKGGWMEYNKAGLDAEITRLTKAWWDKQPENRKFNTGVKLWRLNP